MAYETLIVEKEDTVGIIKLNRPPVNPLNTQMYLDLHDAVSELDEDPAIGAIIITGDGDKAFAAGLDIKDVMGKSVVDILDFTWKGPRKAFDKLTGIEKPTIAAVFGLALGGGCEVAMCCDLRIASEDADFRSPGNHTGHYARFRRDTEAPETYWHFEGKRDALYGRYRKCCRSLSNRSCKQSCS